MDENQQNHPIMPQQPEPKRASFLGKSLGSVFAFGAFVGAVSSSLTNRKSFSLKAVLIDTGVAGIVFSLLHLITRKRQPEAVPPTVPPVIPPTTTDRPSGLGLATIPQILDILVADGQLKPEQQAHVLAEIKNGRTGFAAEIAIADGFITREQADLALGRQAMMKAEAAVQDIQNIKDHGAMPAPAFLRANWGNNGVNPAAAHPTRADGVSAAANAAQNLVMLANANPQLAPALFYGVIAAASLANGIANGDSPITPIAKMGDAWRKTMNDALVTAAHDNPKTIVDAHGKPVDVNQFIAARDAEITAAIAETLKNPPNRDAGRGR